MTLSLDINDDKTNTYPDPWIGPIPNKDAITFAQITVWDNGPEPKTTKLGNKGKRTRYSVTLEAYTRSAERLVTTGLIGTFAFKRNMQLRPAKKFLDLVKRNNATGRISDGFKDLLTTWVNDPAVQPDDLFGFVIDSGTWSYHEGQFIHMSWDRGAPILYIITGTDMIAIDTWDSTENPKDGVLRNWTHEIDNCGYRDAKGKAIASATKTKGSRGKRF